MKVSLLGFRLATAQGLGQDGWAAQLFHALPTLPSPGTQTAVGQERNWREGWAAKAERAQPCRAYSLSSSTSEPSTTSEPGTTTKSSP